MLQLEILYRAIEKTDETTIFEYQSLISPSRSSKKEAKSFANDRTKESAVLILIYPKNQKLHFVLIQRPPYNGTHGGQISLPGGKIEDSDLNLTQTALRETYEEIGVEITEKQIITNLKPIYIPPSNFLVYPFLAYSESTPTFSKDDFEVEEILEIELEHLSENVIKKTSVETQNNIKMKISYYELNQKVVWGATATILAELHAIFDEYKKILNRH